MEKQVYINGRFLAAAFTGVQRSALELVKALDRLLEDRRREAGYLPFGISLLHPASVRPTLDLACISMRPVGRLTGQLWEQIELPLNASDGLLLNFCNIGPVFKRQSVTMIHDVQTRSFPDSYSVAFRLWYRLAQPIIGKMHRQILTVSDFSKAQIEHYGIAPASKIMCVPNGCDHITPNCSLDTLKRWDLTAGDYVLSLASTQKHKNVRVLIDAFSSEALRNRQLVLFGSALIADFERAGMALPDNVRLLGRVTDEDASSLMAHAACFACPSLTEGFGLMPLEAMRVGCPTIIAPQGALPETCGAAALQADPFSPAEWIASIRWLLDDPGLARAMRRRGYDQAKNYAWANSAGRLMQLLSALLGFDEKGVPDYDKTVLRAS